MPAATSELDKLARILGMLGSEHDGERAAAGLLATRTVREMGTTWSELLRPPATPHLERNPAAIGWRTMVAVCRSRPDLLSAWEREFVASVGRQRQVSEKQSAVLARLAQRVWAQ